MGSHVSPIPNMGLDNLGMDTEEKKFPRSNTTLSMVDQVILSKQRLVGEEGNMISRMDSMGNINKELNFEESASGNIPVTNFVSQALTNRGSSANWNPFRKTSGIANVMKAQSKRNRMVSKHGRVNTYTRENDQHERLLKDLFTSMIDLSWSWTLFLFAASFFISWLFFAVIWYLIALGHGDLEEANLAEGSNHTLCVDNVNDFTTSFLFSLETQHTIGYGGRATTSQCSLAIIVMALQSIVGVVISACMAGIFFAKFTTPTSRGETVMFSRNALITMRDGALYLLVRLGDIRQTHLLECHVSGHFLSKKATAEGEVIPYHLAQMEFGSELDGTCEQIQPFWPLVVSHKIDSCSPMYDLAPRDLQTLQFEVILTIEGTTPETGNTIQTRTSYLPQEILWGQRFEHTCVAYDKELSKYAISYATLNSLVEDRTPRLSARVLDERKNEKGEDME